jgi:mannose-6-phosphate isomerase-like protein (cupin superfamily)
MTMKALINQFKPDEEFYTSEKCYITELSNLDDDPDVSIARARVKPGVTTRWHRLRETIERYCIISGCGCVEIGEMPPREVKTGDTIIIPPLCRQRITNVGTEDLIFLAICTPRFKNEIYQELETDQRELL